MLMMANNSFTKCCFVDDKLWGSATYNMSSSSLNLHATPIHMLIISPTLNQCLQGENSVLSVLFHLKFDLDSTTLYMYYVCSNYCAF